jgi:uncharacterized membrane protein YbaN (DUF454 family)
MHGDGSISGTEEPAKGSKKPRRTPFNAVCVVFGFVFLALGAVGTVLPMLPSVPFFLLTLACFLKGSACFYRRFTASRLYKSHLAPFLKTRSMPRPAKLRASLTVTVLFLPPLLLIATPAVRIVLFTFLTFHYIFFGLLVKTAPRIPARPQFLKNTLR